MVMYLLIFFESTLREDAPLISCFRDFGGKTAPALSMIGGHAKSFSSRASQALRFNLKEAQYIVSKTMRTSRNVNYHKQSMTILPLWCCAYWRWDGRRNVIF